MPRDGRGGNGNGGSAPRWVRTLFDQHEERMAEMERAREQMKSAHEERMDGLQRMIVVVQREEMETRRQTREIIAEIARLDAQRAKDSKALVEALRDVRGRVSRLKRG